MSLVIETSKLATSISTISKLIKHPKLKVDAFSQLAFISYSNTLYLIGFGLSEPDSQITLALKLAESTGLEDFMFYVKQSDIEKIFSTLGSLTTLNFTANTLEVFSDNNGLKTELTIIRQKAYSAETENVYKTKLTKLNSLFKAVTVEESIDTKVLLTKLGRMARMRSLDNSDTVTFEPNRVSVQQYNYVAQESFNIGFTARVTLEETKLLMELLRISDTGKLIYEDATLKFYNSLVYFEVNKIKDETYDLNKFTFTEGNEVIVDKQNFISALSMMKNYVDNFSNVFLLVEDDSLVVTTTQSRYKSLSVPVVRIPYTTRGSLVENREYSVLLTIIQGITSILDGNQLTLHFEYKEFDTSLLYISSEENTNFMFLDSHEKI